MSDSEKLLADIHKRIDPTLSKVSAAGLRAWLKTLGFSAPVGAKAVLMHRIAQLILNGEMTEDALEAALVGFEEASGKRIYLFDLEDVPEGSPDTWLRKRFHDNSIPYATVRKFAGTVAKPMTAIYGELNKNLIRIKWAETHENATINDRTNEVDVNKVEKTIVLVADLGARTAELRLDPPENRHTHEDALNRSTAEAYFEAYKRKAIDVLGCSFEPTELRSVIKGLVEENDPRVVRIHLDNHTNQSNTRFKTASSKNDVRDDEDWKNNYKTYGESWAWDSQSFYWLPKPSAGSLRRELFSHIDAVEGFLKVNADCSDEEVEYAVTQIRAR